MNLERSKHPIIKNIVLTSSHYSELTKLGLEREVGAVEGLRAEPRLGACLGVRQELLSADS